MIQLPKYVLFLCMVLTRPCVHVLAQSRDSRKVCEVVFCVDMSGSTAGIFDAMKQSYWKMLHATQTNMEGQSIRVGLIGYSRESFKKDSNYIKVFVQPTENYEEVYLEFCRIKPYMPGGVQMVGALIDAATQRIEWTKSKNVSRTIVIIGNGDIDVGPVTAKSAVRAAKRKGFNIQPVLIKSELYRKDTKEWERLASLCNNTLYCVNIENSTSSYSEAAIDAVRVVNATFNRQIIYYGKHGKNHFSTIDQSDMTTPADGLYERLHFKLFELKNSQAEQWNLVAHYKTSDFELTEIERETLPPQYTSLVADSMMSILKEKATNERDEETVLINELEKIKPAAMNFTPNEDKTLTFDACMVLVFRQAINR